MDWLIPRYTPTWLSFAVSRLPLILMGTLDNLLAAALALAGGVFYVVVYTRLLKRVTSQNIVIGGAAGAIPPLSGWAAAHGHLGPGALFLFVIVLVWTPPHFWALALLIAPGYAAAGVPMLPVVRGPVETSRQIVRYSVGLSAVTLLPALTGTFGALYFGAAVGLNAAFLVLAVRLRTTTTSARAALLFHYSLLYLALLFAAVACATVI